MTTATSVPSNAFNFMNFIVSQVDPRTGQYTCAITLPELKANHLCGPVVPLQLNFNPLNSADSGFGKGWNLHLSQYNPHNRILSLYTGETFKVNPGPDGMEIPEKKLDTFHFHDLGDQRYKIEHKSGLVEILQVGQGQYAMPVEMRSPQGHSVTLEYSAFGTDPLLSKVRNADRSELLRLERQGNVFEAKLYPDTAQEAVFVLNIMGGEVKSLVLPTEDNASWRFEYLSMSGLTLLKEVHTPAGGHETVNYAGTPHSFPGLSDRTLPRVHSHIIYPGFDQPPMETRYEYDRTGNNFLGYGSGVTWSNDGLDNLYRDGVVRAYQYETSEIVWDAVSQTQVRKTRRVFNRFHLQVLEEVSQKASVPGKDTLLVTEIDYYADPLADFATQPAYCQLPKRVTQTWRNAAATWPRHSEVVTSTYDDFGNLLVQVNANGVTETSTWYAADGEEGCPADPQGFVRHIKSKTVTPAASSHADAPTLQTRYRYVDYPQLDNQGRWLALSDETLVQIANKQLPSELRRIAHDYINSPEDPLRHGMISQMRQTLHGQNDTSTVTQYRYETTRNARSGALVMRTETTLIGYDDQPGAPVRKVIREEHSLLNGAKLLSTDDVGTEILYQYDRLGRIIEECVAPRTNYQASRTYDYTLTNTQGQQAQQRTRDVKGVETITWLDGLSRVLKVERQDADALGGDPQAFRETYRATYNNLGQLTSETLIDWEGAKNIALTSIFEYDAWGEQYKVIGADGVARITENDPPTQTLCSWSESITGPLKISGKSRSTLNDFGKEDKVEALDADGRRVSEVRFLYDGLGNCVEQIDPMGESTRFAYDAFGRMQTTTLPDYSQVHRTYAHHSADELAVGIEVVANGSPTCVGLQTFDGLDRRTTLKVGPRLQQFHYKGGQLQVDRQITASQKTISYEYQLGLTGSPVASIAPDEQSSFNYDPENARLKRSENTQGQYGFDYNSTGQLRRESWTDNRSGKQWHTEYTHTLNGRPLTRLNNEGLPCAYDYDDKARLKGMSQGQIRATFEYDNLGQISLISTRNAHTGQVLQTRLSFDDQGREILREMNLGGSHPTQTLTQAYRADSKLHSRHLQQGTETELLETFDYDPRGRLVQYTCEGSQLPKDRYGNGICEQLFAFDALDNVTEVYTLFADGSRDETGRTFAEDDPCRLVGITHSHPDYPPSLELEYDDDGNLLHDENGQLLSYDSQGRLLRVSDSSGKTVSQYRYDAHNHLFGVTRESQGETLRFYDDDSLTRTEQGDRKIHYLSVDDQPLGQQQQDDPEQTLLLMTDAKNSVLAESGQDDLLRKAVYSAYGERRPEDDLLCLLGFNGEVRDELSGWYLLGRGYRAYNPVLMCFHSPDSLSPFDAGGINPYMYAAGDPINFVDPTGHANRKTNWLGVLGATLSAIGIALSIAAVIIAPPVGALAIGVTGTFTLMGVGFGIYGVYEGVMATHATRLRDREQKQMSALISGGLDVAFGLFGLSQAMKAAAKAASAEAAQLSWRAAVKQSLGNANDLMGTSTRIDTSKAAGAVGAVNEGTEIPGLIRNRFKRPAPAQAAAPAQLPRGRSNSMPPIPRPDYPGYPGSPKPVPPPKPQKKVVQPQSLGDVQTQQNSKTTDSSVSRAVDKSGEYMEIGPGRDGKWHAFKPSGKSFSAKVAEDGTLIREL